MMIIGIALVVVVISTMGCIKIKKPVIKGILGTLAAINIVIAVLEGSFIHETRYKIHEVADSKSPDERYELFFQQVGDPDWPFGYTHARLVLEDAEGRISKFSFDVANDGCGVHSKSWQVKWMEDRAEVIISGDEQRDKQYILYFDGRTDSHELETKHGTY